MNELSSLVVRVEESFSSTVARISSSFFSLLCCIFSIDSAIILDCLSFCSMLLRRIVSSDFENMSVSCC